MLGSSQPSVIGEAGEIDEETGKLYYFNKY
jgi:hypothetical protein